jgi:hypothetical protein
VDVHELIEHRLGPLREGRPEPDAAGIHQAVEAVAAPGVALRVPDLSEKGIEGGHVAHVEPQRHGRTGSDPMRYFRT